ncbi:hypothetical protein B0O80DRAFT_447073 [Mortierella sp. GBAus27b]|nr:hypothetical protein B0O80DRAFT_447073 [Mortierella sp. GBAus27b]
MLTIGDKEVDATKILMEARQPMVDGEWVFALHSDLLVMNFIFTEPFLAQRFGKPAAFELCHRTVPPACQRDTNIMGRIGSDISLPKEKFMATLNRVTDGWEHPLSYIIRNLVQEPNFWSKSRSAEGTYQTKFVNHIIRGILHGLQYRDSYTTASLPMPLGHSEDLKPDFFGTAYEETEAEDVIDERGALPLPFIVAEVKKPEVDAHLNRKDRFKIFCEMELMIDTLRQSAVKDPEVIGLLFQDGNCIVYTMAPVNEAIYIPVRWGAFPVPERHLQIGSMGASLSILSEIKAVASTALAKIDARERGKIITNDPMTRRSYHLHHQLS